MSSRGMEGQRTGGGGGGGGVTRVCMCRWDIWTETRGRCGAQGQAAGLKKNKH